MSETTNIKLDKNGLSTEISLSTDNKLLIYNSSRSIILWSITDSEKVRWNPIGPGVYATFDYSIFVKVSEKFTDATLIVNRV